MSNTTTVADYRALCVSWIVHAASSLRATEARAVYALGLLRSKTSPYARAMRVHAARCAAAARVLEAPITDAEWAAAAVDLAEASCSSDPSLPRPRPHR